MTNVFNSYLQAINSISGLQVTSQGSKWNISVKFQSEDPKLQMKELTVMQSQLRLAKKQVEMNIREIRAAYTETCANQTYNPGIGGMLLGASYRNARRRGAAESKRSLAIKKDELLQPHEKAKTLISQVIDQLASFKIELSIKAQQ